MPHMMIHLYYNKYQLPRNFLSPARQKHNLISPLLLIIGLFAICIRATRRCFRFNILLIDNSHTQIELYNVVLQSSLSQSGRFPFYVQKELTPFPEKASPFNNLLSFLQFSCFKLKTQSLVFSILNHLK